MAQESGKTASSSASASAAGGDAYIGSFISLISKYEIRYEGVLYYLNPQDSTLGLNNVRSYGTEGRRKDGPQIPPSDKVYEYILFRGSDIKDLQVKSSPPAQAEELIHNDPAIIQSRYAGGPSSSSKSLPVVGGSFTDFGAYGDISALYTKSYTSARPPHQSGNQVEPWNPQAIQNTNTSSCAMPIHWQGYSGLTSNGTSHNPMQSTNPSLSTIGNLFQASPTQVSTTTALTYPSNCAAPGPMVITSNPAHLSITSSLLTGQLSAASSDLSSSSVKSSLPSYPEVLVGTRLSSSLVPSSSQNRSTIEAPSANKVGSDPVSFHPVQSSYTVPSVVDSSSGSLLNHPPRLLTPDQLLQPRVSELSSTQKLYPDQKDVGVLSSASSNSSSSVTSPAVQAPLLPLPPPSQKLQYSSEFAEEFDFEAMNEKFKKDEIWGYFGKAKQENKTEGTEDNSSVMGNDSSVTKVEAIPAYKKDEFFDTISRNSLSRGARNGQHHFSERMKLDTETFGNYQQRVHPGYAGYGAGHGQYNWRRGYHYGGRGHGRFTRT